MKTFFLSLFCSFAFAQFTPCIPPENIRMAHLFNPQTNDQSPLISIEGERLVFSFDDFDGGFKNYYYKVQYKNPDWSDASIFESEYLNGFRRGLITDYTFSFNTFQSYTNYRFSFPNQNMRPTLSGNYVLTVYDPSTNLPVFCERFALFENSVDIGIQVDRALEGNLGSHQLRVSVASPQQDLTQNPDGPQLVVLKNNNWNERIENPTLTFQQPFQFQYTSPDFRIAAGNEYFWFDTKTIQNAAITTQSIQRGVTDSLFNTYLYYNLADDDLGTYAENPDVNGAFYIRNAELPNELLANHQADYTWVHFGLEGFENPNNQYEVYVVGAFNRWDLLPKFRMDEVSPGVWESKALLKQGFYNYTYAVRNTKTQTVDYNRVGGNFWQTENTYQALFYYQPWGERYYRLLGLGEGYSRPSRR